MATNSFRRARVFSSGPLSGNQRVDPLAEVLDGCIGCAAGLSFVQGVGAGEGSETRTSSANKLEKTRFWLLLALCLGGA